MPGTLHVTAIWPDQIAQVISVIDFCNPFGGTIALAIMGAVFNNKITAQTPGGGSFGLDLHNQADLNAINTLPTDSLNAFRDKARQAVVLAFIAVLPIIALAVLACLVLGNVKITDSKERTETGHLETSRAIEKRPYLLALLSRKEQPAAEDRA